MATFIRFTNDPIADASRTWSYRPCDAANAVLASHLLTEDEILGAIENIREDDASYARELESALDEGLEWTGTNWSTRQDGIPGFEVEDDVEATIAYARQFGAVVSADAAYVAVYEGEWAGDEYESAVNAPGACTFVPKRLAESRENA